MKFLHYDAERPGKSVFQFGLILVLPIVTFAIGWMSLAPLHSAAVASGQVVLTSDRIVVQHLEGGIVDALYVLEGEEVQKGTPIAQIRSTAQLAKQNILQDRIVDARTVRARIIAQLANESSLDFADIGQDIDIAFPSINKYQTRQLAIFDAARLLKRQQDALLETSLSSIDAEIEGAMTTLEASEKLYAVGQQQWEIKQSLQASELASKAEILELRKSLIALESSVSDSKSQITRLRQQRRTLEIEHEQQRSQERINLFNELQETESNLSSYEQELITLRDQLERSQIIAPISGRVLDLQIHSRGEVLAPGDRILDIVPSQQDLIVEARVAPQDIDIVVAGGNAKIQLASFDVTKVPRLDGQVDTVSADILTDPASGQNYYLARIIVDQTPLAKLKTEVNLNPGMPAEVFFLSEERTVLDYLVSPLTTAAYRAFREE